ncbi:MAG: putative house-cleaning NTP pyrophosphatase (Maf/HAM1 superfamily), partial [bacterium]
MFKQEETLLLASNSWGLKYVLDFAKIEYKTLENLFSDIEENSFKETVNRLDIKTQIQKISDYKGIEISKTYPNDYVLSGDQASVVEGEVISKPYSQAEAIAQLTAHAGKNYQLITSITLCKNGQIIWQHQETPTVQLRKFCMKEAQLYVELEEKSATGSVVGIAGTC